MSICAMFQCFPRIRDVHFSRMRVFDALVLRVLLLLYVVSPHFI